MGVHLGRLSNFCTQLRVSSPLEEGLSGLVVQASGASCAAHAAPWSRTEHPPVCLLHALLWSLCMKAVLAMGLLRLQTIRAICATPQVGASWEAWREEVTSALRCACLHHRASLLLLFSGPQQGGQGAQLDAVAAEVVAAGQEAGYRLSRGAVHSKAPGNSVALLAIRYELLGVSCWSGGERDGSQRTIAGCQVQGACMLEACAACNALLVCDNSATSSLVLQH